MINTLKNNVRNKAWWVAVISAIVIISQQKGFDLTPYIGSDWKSTLDTIFYLAMLFGISVNTNNEIFEAPTEELSSQTDNITEIKTGSSETINQKIGLTDDEKLEELRKILNS